MKTTQLNGKSARRRKTSKGNRRKTSKGNMSTKLTAPKLAQLLGVERTTPHRWAEQGCPIASDGRFNPAEVFAWRVSRAAEKSAVGDSEHWLTEWRRARAEREQIALDKDRGALVTRESTVRCWSRHITECAQLLAAIPGMCGLVVGPEARSVVVKEVEQILDRVREILAAGGTVEESKDIQYEGRGARDSDSGASPDLTT